VEIETLGAAVVGVGLNVVVVDVPWHVNIIETVSPGVESWGPEVHHDRLTFGHEFDSGIFARYSAHFLAIEVPRDVVWSPDHLVNVPLVLGVETTHIVVRLSLAVAISVNDIH